MNKFKPLIKVVCVIVLTYSILSVVRSLGMLYLAYTDPYFYNLDFKIEGYIEKRFVYFRFYYTVSYITGIILSFLLKIFYKLNWGFFILAVVISYAIFVPFDDVRQYFVFFENPRTNVILQLMIFLLLGFLSFKYLKNERVVVE